MAQMHAPYTNLRNGVPQQIDIKKLPAGHATFSGDSTGAGLYVCWGHPYDFSGKRLPADAAWLRENGFYAGAEVLAQLRLQQVQNPTVAPKQLCVECAAEVPASSKFCPSCGTPQVRKSDLWTPGSDDEEGNAVSRLIDPADPLGSLQAIHDAEAPQTKRETPEEIFARLAKDEAAKTLRDAGKLPSDADPGLTRLETTDFGTIETLPNRAKGKG